MFRRIPNVCWLLALVPLLTAPNLQAQYLASVTEDGYIQLALDYFIKAVQKTDTATVLAWLGTETVVNGEILDPGPFVRSIFEQADARQTVVPPPSGAKNRTFWDLEVTDMDIDFNSDSTEAQVNCRLILWGAKAEDPQKVKQTSETFTFKRIGEAWNLVDFDNLLDFLWEEVSRYEED